MKITLEPKDLKKLGIDNHTPNQDLSAAVNIKMDLSATMSILKPNEEPKKRGPKPKIHRNVAVIMAHALYTNARGYSQGRADEELATYFGFSDAREIRKIRNSNKWLRKETHNFESLLLDGVTGSPTIGVLLEPGTIQLNDEKNKVSLAGYGWLWVEGKAQAKYNKWIGRGVIK